MGVHHGLAKDRRIKYGKIGHPLPMKQRKIYKVRYDYCSRA